MKTRLILRHRCRGPFAEDPGGITQDGWGEEMAQPVESPRMVRGCIRENDGAAVEPVVEWHEAAGAWMHVPSGTFWADFYYRPVN